MHPGFQWQSVGHGSSGARVGHDSSVGVLDMIPVADVLNMIPSAECWRLCETDSIGRVLAHVLSKQNVFGVRRTAE